MAGNLLLTLVDHAKPFKGTWQIYQQAQSGYSACHSSGLMDEPPAGSSCQTFTTSKEVCHFTELLQFYGWSIEGHSPECVAFRQGCAL